MMKSLAQQLKEELMERYNLREDQVHLELTISTTDLDLGRQVLKDFSKNERSIPYLLKEDDCDSVFGTDISYISVHRKDGRYGTYVNESVEQS